MILIDRPKLWGRRQKRYSHMISDTSLEELHDFAVKIGVKRHWFSKNHYDVREFEFDLAVRAGASVVDSKDIVKTLRGLR